MLMYVEAFMPPAFPEGPAFALFCLWLYSFYPHGCNRAAPALGIKSRKKKGLCQLRPVDFLLHQVATLSCKGIQ